MSVSGSFLLNDSDDDMDDDASTIQQAKHSKRNKRGTQSSASKPNIAAQNVQQEERHAALESSLRQRKRLQTRRMHDRQIELDQKLQHDTSMRPTNVNDVSCNKITSPQPPIIPVRRSSLSLIPITLSSFSEPSSKSVDPIKLHQTARARKADVRANSVCIDMSTMNGDACHLLLNCPEVRRNKYGKICMRIPPEHAPVITAADLARHADDKRYSIVTATFDAKVEQWLAAVGERDSVSLRSVETAVHKDASSSLPPEDRTKRFAEDAAQRQSAGWPLAEPDDGLVDANWSKEHRRRGMHESDAVVQAYMRLCAAQQDPLA